MWTQSHWLLFPRRANALKVRCSCDPGHGAEFYEGSETHLRRPHAPFLSFIFWFLTTGTVKSAFKGGIGERRGEHFKRKADLVSEPACLLDCTSPWWESERTVCKPLKCNFQWNMNFTLVASSRRASKLGPDVLSPWVSRKKVWGKLWGQSAFAFTHSQSACFAIGVLPSGAL